ncbi:MAG: alpha-galactosidase [Dehalococcoidia bacterium]|nr:alpha-galactosidase [Dehalococcoidia bacterium]
MQPTPALPFGLAFAPVGLDPAIRCELEYDDDAWQLQVSLTNTGDAPWRPGDLRLAAPLDLAAADGFAHIHGRYMQMDALVRRFAAPQPEGYDGRYLRATEAGNTYVSRELLALQLPVRATPVLVAGSLRMDRFFLDIELDLDPDESAVRGLALVFDLAGAELAPRETLALPPVYLAEGHDFYGMVEGYADEVAEEMEARPPAHIPTGWCSWYYFYDRVTEADVLRNLETMRDTAHPAEVVQIDDGYQSATGDWLTPNAKFPSGMAALASRMRDAGFTPGLWLAPFLLHENSAALRDHPELALRTHDGAVHFVETWLGRCAVLDCTHPSAETWLRDVVTTVVRDWGYSYLKLDALAFAAASPATVRFHAPGTTAPANLRRGLEIIREAAGDETFILGCTAHFGPAIGLVDAMRVGPDVKAQWADGPNPSVRHAMRLALMRNWMHGRWWANDPDCLVVRETDTELTEAEVRFLAAGIALSGGMVVASDDLPQLGEDRRALALALFPPTGVAARPADPGEAPVPSEWRGDLGEGKALVGVLNWDDSARWVVQGELFRPGEVAFDAFNARVPGMGDVLLRPHEGQLWQVTGRGKTPRVVGDSGSLTYDLLFVRQVSGRVQVRNDSDRPRVVAIEARGQVFEVDLAPGEMRWFD